MLDHQLRSQLQTVSTATVATQLFKRGFRQQFLVGVQPLSSTVPSLVGEAFTMRYIPAREDLCTLQSLHNQATNLQWQAVEQAGEGDVLVIDSRDDTRAGSLGEILATRLLRRGCAGAVTDGAFRDGPAIARLPLATYSRAITASTRLSCFHVADLQVPIGCAGVAVFPRDIIVGDTEGVIVIPRDLATGVAADAAEQEKLEGYLRSRIDQGEPLWRVYPPEEETIAEYNQQRWGIPNVRQGGR